MLSDFGLLRKSCSRRLTLTPMKVVIGYMPDYANPGPGGPATPRSSIAKEQAKVSQKTEAITVEGRMAVIEWLTANAPGFAELGQDERDAMMHFAVLWSFFEERALDRSASAAKIIARSRQWHDAGRLQEGAFTESLAYFRQRYLVNGAPTHHYAGLLLRPNDREPLVRSVLRAENNNVADIVAAMLIIAYRYRNNLLHGEKWAYQIRGQHDNFLHGSRVLMLALEANGGL